MTPGMCAWRERNAHAVGSREFDRVGKIAGAVGASTIATDAILPTLQVA
jgi:hypothetical protein